MYIGVDSIFKATSDWFNNTENETKKNEQKQRVLHGK